MMTRGARSDARELTAAEWLPAPFHCIRMHVFARLVAKFRSFPAAKKANSGLESHGGRSGRFWFLKVLPRHHHLQARRAAGGLIRRIWALSGVAEALLMAPDGLIG